MSSPSSNNGKEDAWLMKMELKAEAPEEVLMVAKDKDVAGDHATALDQALPEEEEDILLPYYEHLTPAAVEAFRMFEVTHAQNKYLTRVNILLEKHIVDLQGINRRLQALVEARTLYTVTNSFVTKAGDLILWYGHSPWPRPSLGELPRYRITHTILTFTFLSLILSLLLLS
jgi:hypothetical protein